MKIKVMHQAIAGLMIYFMCLGMIPLHVNAQQIQQIKADRANSVEYINNGKVRIIFSKVGDKTWNWFVRSSKRTCRETNKDEWAIYLSCSTNNANRESKFTLNLLKREVSRIRPNGSAVKFKITKIGALPLRNSNANSDVTSIDYTSGNNATTKFLKIADKTWRQGPVAAKLIWQETGRDESSIFLSRKNPYSGQEQTVTLNLETKQVLIYSRPGFAPTGFSIAKINRTSSRGASVASKTPATVTGFSKANQDVTSVKYVGNSSIRYEFVKIADKKWRQGPEAAKLT